MQYVIVHIMFFSTKKLTVTITYLAQQRFEGGRCPPDLLERNNERKWQAVGIYTPPEVPLTDSDKLRIVNRNYPTQRNCTINQFDDQD